ncbi:MAG: hypothetical protein H7327_06330 [Herminiimonas sp.]|nr:hypothetical protein [Herminiimonas sp.]
MTIPTSPTYYVLRAKSTTVGDGPYVGSTGEGDHAMVADLQQARRFDAIEDAEQYACKVAESSGEFEIEVRTTA